MRLSAAHKTFIVQRLAVFDTPTEVQEAFVEHFGEEVSTSHIVYYDPNSAQGGEHLAQKWKDLHAQTRADFIADAGTIPIAQKSYRLKRLHENETAARRMKNIPLSNATMEQAAKEMGEAYTNRKQIDHTSGGKEIALPDLSGLSADALARAARDLLGGEPG